MSLISRLVSSTVAAAVLLGVAALPVSASSVKVARFWHNHQPIYWPDWADGHVQYAKDSIEMKGNQGGHPVDNLTEIFGKYDRVKAYQYGPRNSLGACDTGAGYAISYSGSLIDNVRSLGSAGMLEYSSTPFAGYQDACSWTDWKGNRRMEMVGFCYHHALGPVLPKAVFRKEVQMLKQSAWKAWGNDYESNPSKGFFPTEMAFSEEMIDVLADEGYEWVIVASHHLSRTCPTYFNNGTADNNYGINSSEPNRADMNGPSPTDGWWYDSPNPGNAAWNVAPFAYQLHKVQYVNPWTGETKQMVAVPSDDVISYKAGYSGAEMKYAEKIAYGASDANPVIVLPATDGDNAWGGGDSSWMESWPGFTHSAARDKGWDNTTLQTFVDDYKGSATLAHVEDGAWIFPEMCYGSPYFLKWVDPPCNPKNIDACYPGTQVDLETPGFALKFWDWAPIIAAANWCETAEKKLGRADAWRIAAPYESSAAPNAAEWAWHIYLAGLDSGFNYYGGEGNDDECKPPLANLRAIETLRNAGLDQTTLASTEGSNGEGTPPTMFRPQRFPYNPGAYTFGWFNRTPTDGNFRKKMGSDFYVWTHVYDVSGINDGDVKLWVREDKDGYNPVDSIQNETFAGGDEVGEWFAIPMTKRTLPSRTDELTALADNGQINYEFEPAAVADYYFAKVTQFRGKLVDYYVEATDTKGNMTRSDIQHVWVGDDGTAPGEGGGGASASATFSPASPTDCGDITVTFNAGDGVLKDAAQVTMGYNFTGTDEGWGTTNMTKTSVDGVWTFTFTAQTAPFVDNSPSLSVFFNSGTNYESRGGANWTVSIADCDAPINGVKVEPTPAVAGAVATVSYYPAGRVLDGAEAVFAHHGYNNGNWTTVPGDAMTWSTFDRAWTYTFTVPERASTLAFCFNNGDTTWDNNGGDNWTFPVTGTVVPEAWFTGVCAVTNRAEQPYAPLEIGYNPTGRDLAVATAVYVHLGVVTAAGTNWTSYAMSDQGGFWTFNYTPEVGTTGLIACFHDGGTVWDNNDSANWSFDLGENYNPVDDGLAITTPTETTKVDTAKATILGTAGTDIVGPITWTNANAGVGGTFEATPLWSQEVTLAGGSNEIVFTAQRVSGSSGYAADDAANYEEDDFTGLNKGTNFMPWITVIPTGAGGDNDTPDADLAFVVLSPGPKQGCTSTVKFYANNEAAALAHGTVQNVYVHWGATDAGGNASWTEVPGDAMTWVDADGAWEAQIAVPADAVSLSFLFNDGGDTWLHYNDLKGGDQTDWTCEVAAGSAGTQGGIFVNAERGGFGMWEYFGKTNTTKIYRPFGRNLTTNDVLSFTFRNGDIAWYTADTQPGTGAGVCAVEGETIDENCGFRFYFNGGQEVYETPYGNTTIGWTTNPMTVTLFMDDSTNFVATFEIDGELASTISGAFTKPCNAFRAWSYSNKGDESEGQNYDVFVDHLVLGQLVYETLTAKAVFIYGTPGEEAAVETTGIEESRFDPETGKLAMKAKVAAASGTRIDVYTTADLVNGEWTKFKTVTVATDGTVVLDDLDLSGNSLFVTFGRPPTSTGAASGN
ncbi:MAG: hypothetical protein J6Y19_06730 [Kiritimatiellae bacterium]|nr:hypothetical protein [Kiritimatiellia bacterium]